MEKRHMRTEFVKEDDINVLNDVFLLQNSIFLGAGILTEDKALRRMAKYAGLELLPVAS